jgi:hypothetical protein
MTRRHRKLTAKTVIEHEPARWSACVSDALGREFLKIQGEPEEIDAQLQHVLRAKTVATARLRGVAKNGDAVRPARRTGMSPSGSS